MEAEEIEAQLDEHFHVYLVDPRLGFNRRSFRFWIDRWPLEDEPMQRNRKPGHRHTVGAVIAILKGYGYSIIDGVKYEWKAGDSICVPVFAWHRHVNESGEEFLYVAATTGPFTMAMGRALRRGRIPGVVGLCATRQGGNTDPHSRRSGRAV